MFNYCQLSHWCSSWHTLPPAQAPIQDYAFSFRCHLQTLVLYLEAFPLSSEPERAGQEILHPCRWMLSTPVHLYTEICHHPSSALNASCLGPVVSEGSSSPRSVFLGLRLKWICICRLWIHTVEEIQLSEPPEPVWAWMGWAGPNGAWRGGAVFSSVLGAPQGIRLDFEICPKVGGQWSTTTPEARWWGGGYVLGPRCIWDLKSLSSAWAASPRLLRRWTSILWSWQSKHFQSSSGSKCGWAVLLLAHKVCLSSSSTHNYT